MTGGRRYTDEQIIFVLQRNFDGVPPKEIIKQYQEHYNAPEFGRAQYKYVKNTYGDHPDFGVAYVNQDLLDPSKLLKNRLFVRKAPASSSSKSETPNEEESADPKPKRARKNKTANLDNMPSSTRDAGGPDPTHEHAVNGSEDKGLQAPTQEQNDEITVSSPVLGPAESNPTSIQTGLDAIGHVSTDHYGVPFDPSQLPVEYAPPDEGAVHDEAQYLHRQEPIDWDQFFQVDNMEGLTYELAGNAFSDFQCFGDVTGNVDFDQQQQHGIAPANSLEIDHIMNENLYGFPPAAVEFLNPLPFRPLGSIADENLSGQIKAADTELSIAAPNLSPVAGEHLFATSSRPHVKSEGDTSSNSLLGARKSGERHIDDDTGIPVTSPEIEILDFTPAATEIGFEIPYLSGSFAYGQIDTPPPQPEGCTEENRTGWDSIGWYYVGPHDSCPIWVVHRHHIGGFVQFDSTYDVVKMMNNAAPSRPQDSDTELRSEYFSWNANSPGPVNFTSNEDERKRKVK